MSQLKSDDYPSIFSDYIETVQQEVRQELQEQLASFPAFIATIDENKGEYRYAEGKWSIKETLCHIIDAERIMSYRALRFARNDMTALAAFEQDEFVANGRHNERTFESIVHEFVCVRRATLAFFDTLDEIELNRKGMASDRLISVRALIYVIAGHLNHHRFILKERYLIENV